MEFLKLNSGNIDPGVVGNMTKGNPLGDTLANFSQIVSSTAHLNAEDRQIIQDLLLTPSSSFWSRFPLAELVREHNPAAGIHIYEREISSIDMSTRTTVDALHKFSVSQTSISLGYGNFGVAYSKSKANRFDGIKGVIYKNKLIVFKRTCKLCGIVAPEHAEEIGSCQVLTHQQLQALSQQQAYTRSSNV